MIATEKNIKTGEYGKFNDGMSRISDFNTTLEEQKSTILKHMESLNNADVFAGPICESAMEAFNLLKDKLALEMQNFTTIKGYLDTALTNYLNADDAAKQTFLSIKDGKVEISSQATVASTATYVNDKLDQSKVDFVNSILPGALRLYEKYGILPSLTIAQAVHESGWGSGGSVFGVKAGSGWEGDKINAGTWESGKNGAYDTRADFRAYDTLNDAIDDYGKVIDESFHGATEAKNYKDAVVAVQHGKYGKYATDPDYIPKVTSIIENYNLNQWDPK